MRPRVSFLLIAIFAMAASAGAHTLVRTAVPSISGVVFDDANFSNGRDIGEAGLAGWTVTLTPLGGFPLTTTTDAVGMYTFSPVAPESYTVSVTPPLPLYYQTFPFGNHQLVLPQGASAIDVNFGFFRDCLQPPRDMRAWWAFDFVSGTLTPEREGGADGTVIQSAPLVAGKVASAMSFDGSTQYVTVPDANDLDLGTGDFTIDAWIRTTQDDIAPIADKRTSLALGYAFFLFDRRLGFQMGDRALNTTCSNSPNVSCTNFIAPASTAIPKDGQWHHVAVTVDRDQPNGGVLYVDGNVVLVFDPTLRPQSLDNSAPLWIGRRNADPALGDGYLNGAIDELEIFGRALTAAEIQSLVVADSLGKCKADWQDIPVNPTGGGDVTEILNEIGGGIAYFYRSNEQWRGPIRFGTSLGAVDEVTAIRPRQGGIEVVARDGERLADFQGTGSGDSIAWSSPVFFGRGLTGAPSLIQSTYFNAGNFEVVAPRAAGGIAHYWRDNDAAQTPWHEDAIFAAGLKADDVSMIQGNFGSPGNFEVVARIGTRLAHFWRDNTDPALKWHGPTFFASGAGGRPSLILASSGNFEVVAPLVNGGIGQWTRDNRTLEWSGPVRFGSGLFSSVVLSENRLTGQLDAIAQAKDGVVRFTRDATPLYTWRGPFAVAP